MCWVQKWMSKVSLNEKFLEKAGPETFLPRAVNAFLLSLWNNSRKSHMKAGDLRFETAVGILCKCHKWSPTFTNEGLNKCHWCLNDLASFCSGPKFGMASVNQEFGQWGWYQSRPDTYLQGQSLFTNQRVDSKGKQWTWQRILLDGHRHQRLKEAAWGGKVCRISGCLQSAARLNQIWRHLRIELPHLAAPAPKWYKARKLP